ncbi:hypothetical protein RSOCI_03825 [Rhabdochlamydiaceae symbiont of Dictyostelium giganteum]
MESGLKALLQNGNSAHIVEFFAAKNRLILGQKNVSYQSADISTDALFARTSHMEKILQHKADYLISLKANQHYLYEATKDFFAQVHQAIKKLPILLTM